ncbi:hypothetical protein ACVGW4_00315, partial [Enterobacter hormaechei]
LHQLSKTLLFGHLVKPASRNIHHNPCKLFIYDEAQHRFLIKNSEVSDSLKEDAALFLYLFFS